MRNPEIHRHKCHYKYYYTIVLWKFKILLKYLNVGRTKPLQETQLPLLQWYIMYNFQLTLALLYIHIVGIKLSAYLMLDMKHSWVFLKKKTKKQIGPPMHGPSEGASIKYPALICKYNAQFWWYIIFCYCFVLHWLMHIHDPTWNISVSLTDKHIYSRY